MAPKKYEEVNLYLQPMIATISPPDLNPGLDSSTSMARRHGASVADGRARQMFSAPGPLQRSHGALNALHSKTWVELAGHMEDSATKTTSREEQPTGLRRRKR